MTKQEQKMREDLILLISDCYSKEGSVCKFHPVFQPGKFLNKLFPYLRSKGIVRKVGGEWCIQHGYPIPCAKCGTKHGQAPIESLIEENK